MLANCSICLSAYKGPVSIPCGHIYCKKCLADHVNSSSGMGEITASCPTCRSTFYIVKPDLTYLPKKYHEYVLPAVRRVYMDSTLDSSLQQKLAKSEARVAKLENEQEIVLNQCEAHMAASQAHAFGEHNALKEVERLKRQMDGLSSQMKDRDMLQNQLIEEEVTHWKTKYRRLKQRLQSIERSVPHSEQDSNSSCNLATCHGTWTTSTDDESMMETHTAAMRQTRPIPRRATRSSISRSWPATAERPKRRRFTSPINILD